MEMEYKKLFAMEFVKVIAVYNCNIIFTNEVIEAERYV
jgi:hypothetical protein